MIELKFMRVAVRLREKQRRNRVPEYGVKFVTEDELHFFKDVAGKKVLEICCGSGHSLKYLADRKAAEPLFSAGITCCTIVWHGPAKKGM